MKKARLLTIFGVLVTLVLSSCDFLTMSGSTVSGDSSESSSSSSETLEDEDEDEPSTDSEPSGSDESPSSGDTQENPDTPPEEECTHEWSSTYQYDSSNHWLECLLCGEIANYSPHELVEVVKDPTCVDSGYKAYYCSVCSYYTYEELSPTGNHIYEGEGVVTKEPTCQEEGERTWTCSVCHEATKTETIAKLDHDFTSANSLYGYDEDSHWKICGNEGCNETSSPLEHDFNIEGSVTLEPTCTDKGLQTMSCECGYTSSKELEANGHTPSGEINIIKEATCTEVGYWSYKCAVCGQDIEQEEYGPLGHDYQSTYDENGHFDKCTRCNDIINYQEHIYTSEVTKEPNCIEKGEKEYHCEGCDYCYSETLETNDNHDFVLKERYAGTCQEDGYEYYECSRCEATETINTGKGDHSWSTSYSYDEDYHWIECLNDGCTEIKDKEEHNYTIDTELSYSPDCETEGLTVSICECGKLKEEMIPATGHDYGEWEIYKAPTCGQAGEARSYCQNEGCDSYMSYEIPATGEHSYGEYIQTEEGHYKKCSVCGEKTELEKHVEYIDSLNPTCEDDGYTETYCSVCGYIISEKESIAATGHSWSETYHVDSSCYELGYTDYKCLNCEATYREYETEYAAHTLPDEYEFDEDTHYKVCSVCHQIVVSEAHTLTASFTDSKWVTSCSVCGFSEDTNLDSKYVIVGEFEGDNWTLSPEDENLILPYSSLYSNTKIWTRTIQFASFDRQFYDPSFRICEYDETNLNWVTVADYTNVDLTSSTDGFKDHYDGWDNLDHNIEGYWGGTYDLVIDCSGLTPSITITYHEDGFIRGTILGAYAIYGSFGGDNDWYDWNAYPDEDSPYYLADTGGDLIWEREVTLSESEGGYSGFRIVNYGTYDTVIDARNLTADSTGVSAELAGDYNILGTYGFTYDLIIDMSDETNPYIKVTLVDDDDYDQKYGNLTLNITITYNDEIQSVPEYADLYYTGDTGEWVFEKASVSEDNSTVYQIQLSGITEGWYGFSLSLDYSDSTDNLDSWTYKVNIGSGNEYFEVRANDFSKGYINLTVETSDKLENIIADPTLAPAVNVTFSITVEYFSTYGWQVYIIGNFNDDNWEVWHACEYNDGKWDYTFDSLNQGRVTYAIVLYPSDYTPEDGVWGSYRYQSEDIRVTITEASSNTTFEYIAMYGINFWLGY